jgi:hypothetical protein
MGWASAAEHRHKVIYFRLRSVCLFSGRGFFDGKLMVSKRKGLEILLVEIFCVNGCAFVSSYLMNDYAVFL